MSNSLPPFLATDPNVYEHFMGRWSARLAKPFLEFAGVQPGDRVLDVGCGTGTLSLALAEHGATVVGMDASESTWKVRVVVGHILMSPTSTATHATCGIPPPHSMRLSRPLPSMSYQRSIWSPPRCGKSHVQVGSWLVARSTSGVATP